MTRLQSQGVRGTSEHLEEKMWGRAPEDQALWGLAWSLSLLETTHRMVSTLKILTFTLRVFSAFGRNIRYLNVLMRNLFTYINETLLVCR